MISKILVPIDGSKIALKSAEYAVGLAKETGASIVLLTVVEKGYSLTMSLPADMAPSHLIEPLEDFMRQAAETYLEEAERLCDQGGVRSEKITRSGHPVEEIIKEAERSNIDLIVIGSHGKSALKAAVLGSVTFGVIHKDTKIPVLVVRR